MSQICLRLCLPHLSGPVKKEGEEATLLPGLLQLCNLSCWIQALEALSPQKLDLFTTVAGHISQVGPLHNCKKLGPFGNWVSEGRTSGLPAGRTEASTLFFSWFWLTFPRRGLVQLGDLVLDLPALPPSFAFAGRKPPPSEPTTSRNSALRQDRALVFSAEQFLLARLFSDQATLVFLPTPARLYEPFLSLLLPHLFSMALENKKLNIFFFLVLSALCLYKTSIPKFSSSICYTSGYSNTGRPFPQCGVAMHLDICHGRRLIHICVVSHYFSLQNKYACLHA